MKKLYTKFKTLPCWKKVLILLAPVAIFLLCMWWFVWSWEVEYSYESGGYYCDIEGVSIQGDIYSHLSDEEYSGDYVSADDIIYQLSMVDGAPLVILDITSWGGMPAASKEIADYVAHMSSPVVASIREAATSGGYYVASQADEIFASPFSDIGSIGITMSYLDESILNEQQGYTWNSLSTGRFKDIGNPQKPLTQAERDILQQDLDTIYEQFVADVATARNMTVDEVRTLADGRSFLAQEAVKRGLIDGVLQQWEVVEYAAENYDLSPESLCWNSYAY